VRFHDSFRIGTIRILNNAVAEAEKTRFAHSLEKIRRHHAPAYLVAFGGNISRAYAMLDKTGDDLIRLHELETLCAKLRALRREGRMQVCNLDGHKADAIVPALEIFIEIASACPSLRGVCVSKTGLGDGLIRDLYKQLQA
jgi:exopolyphosphatase/guanosine-5'-triphosphate,3'-diphosphate pyrophosphatase